jgi:hypothetical protein
MSVWGAYVENLYDLVSIIHRVVPQNKFFIPNEQLFKQMFCNLCQYKTRQHKCLIAFDVNVVLHIVCYKLTVYPIIVTNDIVEFNRTDD